jgi:hypothetical protein
MTKARGHKKNASLKEWLKRPQFKEIVIKSKKVKGLSVSLNWDCGEGHSGDYQEDDPTDMPLLRFDVSYEPKPVWHYDLQNASYCTNLTVLDDRDLLTKAVEHILIEAENTFKFDVANDEAKVGKRIMEGLSWLRIEKGKVV